MAHSTPALFLALILLLLPLRDTNHKGLISFASAAQGGNSKGPPSSGSGEGGGGSSGENSDDENPSSSKGKPSDKKKFTKGKKPSDKIPSPSKNSQPEPTFANTAIPLLWNAASKSAAAAEDTTDIEDYNAALNRMFEKRLAFHPRIRGALEDINDALSRDLLETSKKMSPSQRQRILYSLGGRGTYMEVPKLLHELRQEADHPVEEQVRIRVLHRKRRRGIPINLQDLKLRPFVRKEFEGPVTTTDIEPNLTEAEMQQRQAGVNGWLKMQERVRQAHRQHLRHRRSTSNAEPINDDDFQVDDEDVSGLSFNAELSDQEGGDFLREYQEYIAKMEGEGKSENLDESELESDNIGESDKLTEEEEE